MVQALLYLGVKNIHLGPTLPAFLSPNVANILVENFGPSFFMAISSLEREGLGIPKPSAIFFLETLTLIMGYFCFMYSSIYNVLKTLHLLTCHPERKRRIYPCRILRALLLWNDK